MPEQEHQLLLVLQYQVQEPGLQQGKLSVIANSLKRLQVLQQEELKLQQKKEQLKLGNELAKSQAEERALAKAKGTSIHDSSSLKSASRVSAWVERVRKNNNDLSNIPENIQSTSLNRDLNPEAKYWGNNNHQKPIQVTQPASFMQEMENLLIQQQQHTLVLVLPQPELPTLGRDPIEYYNIRSFENLIEARTDKALLSNTIYNWRCSRINDWLFINESRSRLLQGRKAIKRAMLERI